MEKTFTFAQRLQALIDMKGLSKSEIARACGIDRSNITRYLDGEYEAKQDVVFSLSQKYGVSESWLMGYDTPIFKEDAETPDSDLRSRVLRAFDQLDPDLQEIFAAQAEAALAAQKARGTHQGHE